jgi:chaperonin GroES
MKPKKPMKIRPLRDRVLIRRMDETKASRGGIVIPDTAAEKPAEGEVVAVGEGRLLDDGTVQPIDIRIGDRVLFGKHSGTQVQIESEELLVMREEDVLAVIGSVGFDESGIAEESADGGTHGPGGGGDD